MNSTLHPRAFSLVEVTMALAVISFCLLTLVALLPLGLNSTRDSVQKTNAAGIASQIAADLRDTPMATNSAVYIPTSPRFGLTLDSTSTATPPPGSTNTFYLDDTGNPTGAINAAITSASLFKATVVVLNPKVAATATSIASGPPTANKPVTVRIMVSWPAQVDRTAGAIPTNYQGYFESETAIDRN